MTTMTYPHRVVLLATAYKDPKLSLLFAKARLYMDRIELSGWHLGETVKRSISLNQVNEIDWTVQRGQSHNVVFHLSDGTRIPLCLKRVGQWRTILNDNLRWSAPGRLPMTSDAKVLHLPLKDLIAYTTGMA